MRIAARHQLLTGGKKWLAGALMTLVSGLNRREIPPFPHACIGREGQRIQLYA